MQFLNLLIPLLFVFNISWAAPLDAPDATTKEITKRDYAILTEFLTVLEQSGIALDIVKILATNSITEPILTEAAAAFIKIQNLDDLLTAVDKSGLTVDIILRALQDSAFLPGAYSIVHGLMNGNQETTAPNSNIDTVGLVSNFASLANTYGQFADQGLGDVVSQLQSNLGLGGNGGIFSYLSPVISLVGLGRPELRGSNTISLSPSATAAATNSAAQTAGATATSAPTSSGSGSKSPSSPVTTASATTSSPAPSHSNNNSNNGLGGILNGIFNTINSWFSKRDLVEKRDLEKRDNEILDNLLESVEKSGLGMQLVAEIFDDSAMYPFARDLIVQIVKQNAISLDALSSALDSTNLLNNGLIGALRSPNLGITIN